MDVRTIPVGSLETNCYILVEGSHAVVIDPGDDGVRIMSAIGPSVTVDAILLTHGHFDHTSAAAYLHDKTGAPVYIGSKDKALLRDPDWMREWTSASWAPVLDVMELKEGDQVTFGDVILEVWETPGHSQGSVTFIWRDPQAGTGGDRPPMHVFNGDLIFRSGVGRTDLPGGDPDALIRSVGRVLRLPDKTVIYPGHGPSTTVGREKIGGRYA